MIHSDINPHDDVFIFDGAILLCPHGESIVTFAGKNKLAAAVAFVGMMRSHPNIILQKSGALGIPFRLRQYIARAAMQKNFVTGRIGEIILAI